MILTSCENINNDHDTVNLKDTIDRYFFKLDSDLVYKYSDFELYDSSTHIFYFKTNHPEFKTIKASVFSILANDGEIYKGVFWPPYSSLLPFGAYISSFFSYYPDYTVRIEFVSIDNKPKDIRNDPSLISSLKDHDLLHSGLYGKINNITGNSTHFMLSFVVTNYDKSDLLILDPLKMGPKLFHYFTNAPSFYNKTQQKVFSAITEYQAPSASNSWSADWLSQLKSGESRQFTFNYTLESPLSPGEYIVSYKFPGLSFQLTKDQLYQNNIRVWMGDIQLTKKMSVP